MNYLNKLIVISSNSIDGVTDKKLPLELELLYQLKNGFIAFENTFRIYNIDTIEIVNKFVLPELKGEMLFFGDNSLGDGFCLKNGWFYKYDFETGELEFMGEDLNEFSKSLLLNYNYYTGYTLAKEWMNINGGLSFDKILMPRIPFILGGEYSVQNLVLYSRNDGFKKKMNLCKKISCFNDGEEVLLQEFYKL